MVIRKRLHDTIRCTIRDTIKRDEMQQKETKEKYMARWKAANEGL